MAFCSNCGTPLDAYDKFCKNCGATVAENDAYSAPAASATPSYEPAPDPAPSYTPSYTPNYAMTETVPQVYAEPVCSTKAKVLGFIGMGLAIGGLFFAVIGILYTFLGMFIDAAMGFAYSFAFGLFSFPMSIVGGILCNNSMAMGNQSAACSVGSKLRIAGIIVSAVMLFFGFISFIGALA